MLRESVLLLLGYTIQISFELTLHQVFLFCFYLQILWHSCANKLYYYHN